MLSYTPIITSSSLATKSLHNLFLTPSSSSSRVAESYISIILEILLHSDDTDRR
jgi:hypothetical protein